MILKQVTMMNREKLTIDQFNVIKKEIQDILVESETSENVDEESLVSRYITNVNKLLSYDLSDIPFEMWKDVYITDIDGRYKIDFSKTHANLDFSLNNIVYDDDNIPVFKGCNIISKINLINFQVSRLQF